MSAPFTKWTVLPHGELTEVEDDLLTVVGEIKMPIGELPRRMTVVRLFDQRLVIFSAIALDPLEMAALEAYGRPTFLIVPNDHHRQDARIWKQRYPQLQVIAPEGAADKIADTVRVDAFATSFGDPTVRLVDVPGTRKHEFALEVETPLGFTLVLNDLVANIRNEKGFGGWLLRLMKFAGDEPHIPAPIRAAIVRDKGELRDQLLRWADHPLLRRIIVSHGEIIETAPAEALRKLAASLG